MASAVIHMAVANEINKVLKRDNNVLLIGSIAPDLGKFLGNGKVVSHFQDSNNNIPNLNKFLDKYRMYLKDDFVMGYYIHLYTDYLWFKYFMTEIFNEDKSLITKLDGTDVKCTRANLTMYLYNDYTNANITLIDDYDLDLSVFYNDLPKMNNIIEEIDMKKISLIIDEMSTIIENSKKKKDLVFKIDDIEKFISTSTELILSNINELNI